MQTDNTTPADVVREPAQPLSENLQPAGGSTLAGCPMFPPDNEWNRRVSTDPVDPRSAEYLAGMNAGTRFLRADFGGNGEYGIPWAAVSGSQARVPITFDYSDESDPGPYPIPADAPIEGGAGDGHVLLVDRDSCLLYETFDTHYVGPGWHGGSGAVFDLKSNAQRPPGWTSADADPSLPPMGLRVRLEASYDTSAFGPTARVVLIALREYGMFLADNG